MAHTPHTPKKKPLIFRGFSSPRYTQVPDEVFDLLLPYLSHVEVVVLLYVIRRTFGFKKDDDNISVSQMVHGVVRRDGHRLDHGTGLSRSGVLKGVKGLVEKNILVRTQRSTTQHGDLASNYKLNVLDSVTLLVSPQGGSPHNGHGESTDVDTGGVHARRQGESTGVDPQETVLQETEHTSVSSSSQKKDAPHTDLVAFFHQKAGHATAQETTPKELKQAKDLLAAHDLGTCQAIVTFALEKAKETSFKPRTFGGILQYVPEALTALAQQKKRKERELDDRRRRREQEAKTTAERDAYFARPLEERVELALARRVAVFKILEHRDPTDDEVAALRARLVATDSAATPPTP